MNKITVFVLLFFFCFLQVKAETVIPKDTLSTTSFHLDIDTLASLQNDGKHDYYQKELPAVSWWNELRENIRHWLNKRTNISLKDEQVTPFLIISSIVLLILVGVLLYIFKPKLFYLNKKRKLSYQLDEETLGSLSYDQLIAQALRQEAYAEAIRWEYLHVLSELHARNLISYDSNKTVNEYVYEIKEMSLRSLFRNLSSRFLYYRYGNGVADQSVFDAFMEQSKRILNTIGAV